jgi:glycogen operon protein
MLSQGTPMLLGGDERCRTQDGNNNAWCQDTELSWYDWGDDEGARSMLDWTRRLIALRRDHPTFRREKHLTGKAAAGSGLPDVWWFRADGRKMTRRDWQSGEPVVGMFLNGAEIGTPGPRGEHVEDDSFLLIFNAHHEDREFTVPNRRFGWLWSVELTTADPSAAPGSAEYDARSQLNVTARSITVLKRVA